MDFTRKGEIGCAKNPFNYYVKTFAKAILPVEFCFYRCCHPCSEKLKCNYNLKEADLINQSKSFLVEISIGMSCSFILSENICINITLIILILYMRKKYYILNHSHKVTLGQMQFTVKCSWYRLSPKIYEL